jgi:hypothetical protein
MGEFRGVIGVEYRWADLLLTLNEAMMIIRTLFTGLLYTSATSITDDPFHDCARSLVTGAE